MVETVIDASILVKWYIQEIDSDRALLLRDRHINGELRLAAPVLIFYEALNALRYSGQFSTKELKEIALSIQNYGFALYGPEKNAPEILLDAAEDNRITVYDSAYVALAMNLETELITADQRLIDRLVGDYAKHVKHLRAIEGRK